jgi:hypothetical protein
MLLHDVALAFQSMLQQGRSKMQDRWRTERNSAFDHLSWLEQPATRPSVLCSCQRRKPQHSKAHAAAAMRGVHDEGLLMGEGSCMQPERSFGHVQLMRFDCG